MKLLVIDDQSPVGEIVCRIARQAGWDAVHTVTTERLAEIIRSERVDVLLVDFAIDGRPNPGRNGLTVVRQLREQGLDLPAIVFTGWPDLVDRGAVKALGILRVLEKPLGIQELRQALAEARKVVLGASAPSAG